MRYDEDLAADAVARLRRIEGQVAGIARMIEGERECRDVLAQISAASKALEQVGFKILARRLRECVSDPGAAEASGYSEEELERLFLKLA